MELRRCPRDVTGPGPNFVALRAKPHHDRETDKAYLARRKKDEEVLDMLHFIKLYDQCRMAQQWHLHSQGKWLRGAVQRKVEATMREYREEIEERRERLRQLLEAEERGYMAEMEALEGTVQEKEAKMRERVQLLREKREKERQQLVAEKREQQFREQCDELRLCWVKRHQKEVFGDQLAQVAVKEELKKQQKKEDQLFAELWEQDRLAKEQREVVERQKAAEQSQATQRGLLAQLEEHKAHQEEAKRLKEQEAQWLEEEQQQLKVENFQLKEERVRKQKECRDMLLRAVQERKNYLHEEKQDELALELKILEECLKEPQEDTEEKRRRKQELLMEQQTYLAHLAKQLEVEKQREEQAAKLIQEDAEKIWSKKAQQMRAEKEARKQLLRDVLNTRQQQIEEKLQRNAKEQEESAQERRLLDETIAELECNEEKQYMRKLQEAREYREHLKAQITHRQQARAAEEEEKQQENQLILEAHKAHQEKIHSFLAKSADRPGKVHPMRRLLESNSQENNLL